ncbi:hypothetical protein QDR37_14280 [Amnibacterium sp. CER49]|uniref:hypothetical protein n=1 Tax=Amnibacterium sp. CER49 TaxID=3039161 RepID=UPI002448BAD8|nr:hypothetical protein [Amnibacterium sp. CER49]MDH2445117.1 hypothetical protein [Amnibacterium sp. CER49]
MGHATVADIVACCTVVALIFATAIARFILRGPDRRVRIYAMTRWPWAVIAAISLVLVIVDEGKVGASWFAAVSSAFEAALTQLIHFGLRQVAQSRQSRKTEG